jgi:glyoxylase-like metal-dependent hydrolase (beta-lactamase superfamily II)
MTINPKTYTIGDAKVSSVDELTLNNVSPASLFPDWNPELLTGHQSWLSPDSMDMDCKHAFMSVHTWIIQTKNHTILIDTGVGNDKDRPYTPGFNHLKLPYLEKLSALGVKPEEVDYVLMTHLHVDHVGWNTRYEDGHWVPTFPNARYVFSKKEYEYYTNPANHNDRNKTSAIILQDSIVPVIDAGLADMIKIDGSEVIDSLSFMPTPGHSIDHASIRFSSHGEEALFAGDLLHHPIQVRYPELNSVFDAFPEQAHRSRLWALEYAIKKHATLFCSHFPGSSAGLVTHNDQKFNWQYL